MDIIFLFPRGEEDSDKAAERCQQRSSAQERKQFFPSLYILKFYLFYGFYDVNIEKEEINEIIYKYLDISNILNEILIDFNKFEYYKKIHYQIPINLLKNINDNIMNINEY